MYSIHSTVSERLKSKNSNWTQMCIFSDKILFYIIFKCSQLNYDCVNIFANYNVQILRCLFSEHLGKWQ